MSGPSGQGVPGGNQGGSRGGSVVRWGVRAVTLTVLLTTVVYYLHRLLVLRYYHSCRADLFRVVLYQQSAMCVHMGNLLQVVEMAYHQVAKQAAARALWTIGDAARGGSHPSSWVTRIVGQLVFGR
jgi:hypothetical protein